MKTILVLSTLTALALTGAYADTDTIELTTTADESEVHRINGINAVIADLTAEQTHCLAEAIYFEGGNQTPAGMEAIGHVIMNRVESKHFPDSICGVVHQGPRNGGPISLNRCQFSYFCDGKGDVFPKNDTPGEVKSAVNARTTAEIILTGTEVDATFGSDHYHANYTSPPWSKVYSHVATVDAHLFYTSN
jgi:spore germination cell wall hydrolase CwlJ-like protein|tara:strand:- start:48 stop:620 length:573 start_codon:yes stop_codon:yes gene_type:complete